MKFSLLSLWFSNEFNYLQAKFIIMIEISVNILVSQLSLNDFISYSNGFKENNFSGSLK